MKSKSTGLLGFRFWGLGFRVRVWGLVFRVRVWGLGFQVFGCQVGNRVVGCTRKRVGCFSKKSPICLVTGTPGSLNVTRVPLGPVFSECLILTLASGELSQREFRTRNPDFKPQSVCSSKASIAKRD